MVKLLISQKTILKRALYASCKNWDFGTSWRSKLRFWAHTRWWKLIFTDCRKTKLSSSVHSKLLDLDAPCIGIVSSCACMHRDTSFVEKIHHWKLCQWFVILLAADRSIYYPWFDGFRQSLARLLRHRDVNFNSRYANRRQSTED